MPMCLLAEARRRYLLSFSTVLHGIPLGQGLSLKNTMLFCYHGSVIYLETRDSDTSRIIPLVQD